MKWSLRKRQRRNLRRAAALVFVPALTCAVAASTPRLESVWAAEALTIDGVLKEWVSLVSLDPAKISVGVRNDGQFLYVALTASDQSTRMLLGTAGFTVWFDPAGKNKKVFGITIPPTVAGGPGMRGRGPGGPPGAQGEEGRPAGEAGPPPEGQGGPPAGREGQEDQRGAGRGGPGGPGAMEPPRHIEVAGPGKDDRRRFELTYARTIGIDVAAKLAEGVLAYEIRVPLAASPDQPHAVRSAPGAVIGLGIETNKIERGGRGDEGGRGGRGGGGPGGGGGGIGGPGGGGGIGGGGMGGGRGGGRGGGMGGGMMGGGPGGGGRSGMDEQKPIRVWTTVHLVNPPA